MKGKMAIQVTIHNMDGIQYAEQCIEVTGPIDSITSGDYSLALSNLIGTAWEQHQEKIQEEKDD